MYKFFENIKLAVKAIWGKKIRSFLTMLGVIIGVFAIVLLAGIGEGVKSEVTGQIEGLGSNLLFLMPGANGGPGGGGGGPMASGIAFAPEDVEIIEEIEGVKYVVPVTMIPLPISNSKPVIPSEMTAEQIQASAETTSESESMFEQSSLIAMATTIDAEFAFTGDVFSGAEYGRMFTEQEYDDADKVAVLLSGALKELYPNVTASEVVGTKIYIGKEEFEVVGTVESDSEEESGVFGGGQELSNIVIVPLTAAHEIMDSDSINQIAVTIEEADKVDAVKEEIRLALLEAHEGVEDFSMMTQEELLSMFDQILGVLTTMLGGIAAISLLVGGIGVMNIMLVSVTERTKEIGLRKAIGASGADILVQFLVEAIFLTFLGGAIGIGLAYTGGLIMDAQWGLAAVITIQSILLAFSFTTLIGIFFGVAPAIRAARLDPIDALKYE